MKKLVIIGAILSLISCNQAQDKISDTAILISNVTVIDVITGELFPDRQMVIDSGKIKKIVKSIENEEIYKTIIDGQGKYALPGLAEMHAHIPSPPTSKETNRRNPFSVSLQRYHNHKGNVRSSVSFRVAKSSRTRRTA